MMASNSADCLTGLVTYPLIPASAHDAELPRRPTVCMMTICVLDSDRVALISSVSAKPLVSGICMSSRATWKGSPRPEAARIAASASRPPGTPSCLMFHAVSMAESAFAAGFVVVDDEHPQVGGHGAPRAVWAGSPVFGSGP